MPSDYEYVTSAQRTPFVPKRGAKDINRARLKHKLLEQQEAVMQQVRDAARRLKQRMVGGEQ